MAIDKNHNTAKIINLNKINLFIKLEFILCFFIVLFTVSEKNNLVSICFTLSFIILFIYFVQTLVTMKLEKYEGVNFMLLVIIVCISFVAVLQGSSGISFEYFKKYLMFCSTIIFMFVSSKLIINRKTVNYILLVNTLIGGIYIYSYYFGQRGYYGNMLSFNFTNPNLTALWILQTILYMFIALIYYKKKIIRVLSLILIIACAYFLFKTGSRTCLITLGLFLILALYLLLRENIKINRFMSTTLMLFPIIIAILYLSMIKIGNINTIGFMESEGKGIYSREIVWTSAFERIKEYPILGAYYQISDGIGMSQMHNSHLDVWTSYGSIVFIFVLIFMIRIVDNIRLKCATKFQTISLLSFFTVIVMGMGEAALFSGGVGIYILACSFLLLARYSYDGVAS